MWPLSLSLSRSLRLLRPKLLQRGLFAPAGCQCPPLVSHSFRSRRCASRQQVAASSRSPANKSSPAEQLGLFSWPARRSPSQSRACWTLICMLAARLASCEPLTAGPAAMPTLANESGSKLRLLAAACCLLPGADGASASSSSSSEKQRERASKESSCDSHSS